MRTTIVLDDQLARQAKQVAARRGVTLSDLVGEALRAALAQPAGAPTPFEMITFGAGEPPVGHEPQDFKDAEEDDDRRSLRG